MEMSNNAATDYTFLDRGNVDHPVLFVSDAHSGDLNVQSAIASAFKLHPELKIERIQLDKLKQLQQEVVASGADASDYSSQQAKIIDFFR